MYPAQFVCNHCNKSLEEHYKEVERMVTAVKHLRESLKGDALRADSFELSFQTMWMD